MANVADSQPPLADDLIWSIDAIALEIGKTRRQTVHLIEKKAIPVGKVAGRLVASRAKLRAHFAMIVSGQVA